VKTALFKFSDDLKIFLKNFHQDTSISYSFQGDQSVKHLIESIGIPHTEIGKVLANGETVGINYITSDRDIIEVFPIQREDLSLETPIFLLDNHLGRLAAYLRMLGFDSLYRNDFQDDELASIASQSDRVLLTRDLRLLMRKVVRRGYWLRSKDPREQVLEVVQRFRLADQIEPFKRCIRCNELLLPVEKEQVMSQLEPLTRKYFNEYRICTGCGQVYWQGSHYERMKKFIEAICQG
jgi:uncharacterized protein with PIN domain